VTARWARGGLVPPPLLRDPPPLPGPLRAALRVLLVVLAVVVLALAVTADDRAPVPLQPSDGPATTTTWTTSTVTVPASTPPATI